VTVLDGLPRNDAFLAMLARDLKRACGAGGTIGDGTIEIQGDVCERVRALLSARGFTVKG
jgi:translation initiation factor 1